MDPKKLARKVLPKSVHKLSEETYRKGRLGLAHLRYGLPARGLRVIAVTGTNGKTTTCSFINDLLKNAGYKTAMFTTALVEMNGERTLNRIHRTVPHTQELFQFLRRAKLQKVDFVILEITSHALHQHKVWGIPVEVAVMTNISQDHLDYHETMEQYASVKARLFNRYMKPKHAVLNRDDDWFEFFKERAVGDVTTYGQHRDSTIRIANLDVKTDGSVIELHQGSTKLSLNVPLIGEFNAYNAAAAATTGLVLELTPAQIEDGIRELKPVPGRLELVEAGQPFKVVVDYAHAPDSLKNVLEALRKVTKGRVMAVFGATGDRDKSKRPVMGEVASKHADLIFLTDDETYSENAATIRKAVFEGITQAGGQSKTKEFEDRLKAIEAAFKEAKAGDTVLLAGLGHQDYRAMNKGKMPWDEAAVAKEVIRNLNG